MTLTWKPDVMIYHSPCDDGFGAAFAAWDRWGDTIEYLACCYGQVPPNVAGKHVLIGDFSFKKPVLEQMAGAAKSIVILDHHKTAEEDLCEFTEFLADGPDTIGLDLMAMEDNAAPPIVSRFDMNKSGARLVWEFCHPGQEVPQLIQFIEDRDLWRFEHPRTKAFSLFLRSMPYDFHVWAAMRADLEQPATAELLFAEADGIERFYNQKVSELVREARFEMIDTCSVPVVNCSWAFASDVAHELLQTFPSAPFAACYYDRANGSRTYSLRSEDRRADVSAVARRYGGGGHRNAAGFEVPRI